MKRGRSNSAPSYRRHKGTGQALVEINGKSYYLGKYGTQQSKAKYKQVLADKWSEPGTTPKHVEPEANQKITINLLVVEFGKYAKLKYGLN